MDKCGLDFGSTKKMDKCGLDFGSTKKMDKCGLDFCSTFLKSGYSMSRYSSYNEYLERKNTCKNPQIQGPQGATGTTGPTGAFSGIVDGNLLPSETDTWSLGASGLRFLEIHAKSLYVSQNTIYIGDAVIEASGNFVQLPISSTVGGINPGSITIRGEVATTGDLPTDAASGDGYIITNHLWVAAVDNPASVGDWVDVGQNRALPVPPAPRATLGKPGPPGKLVQLDLPAPLGKPVTLGRPVPPDPPALATLAPRAKRAQPVKRVLLGKPAPPDEQATPVPPDPPVLPA